VPRPRRPVTLQEAADGFGRVAPLANRWIERLLAAHDPPLTVAQYLALQAVSESDVAGAELARRAAVSQAAVSQLLASLEDAGLLDRLRATDDRRRQTLSLTPTGVDLLRSTQAFLRERLATILSDLPPPEIDALARLLPRLEALLSGQAPPLRPHRPPPPHRRR
jgi:DNA-binding MarR family transcriptional regulator